MKDINGRIMLEPEEGQKDETRSVGRMVLWVSSNSFVGHGKQSRRALNYEGIKFATIALLF